MSKDFEELANSQSAQDLLPSDIEGLESDIFNMFRTMVGDMQLSKFQAQQLHEDLKASYEVYDDDTNSISDEDLSINLRDEVHQQISLLKALRKDLFFKNGAPRPDTEASDIRGYLSSSIQLLNLLQKFEEALKTDADVRKIEAAIEDAMEIVSDHPDSTVVALFVTTLTKSLEGTLDTQELSDAKA